VALAAFKKLAARGVIAKGSRVVVISTAHGLKFAEQKAAYHMGQLPGVESHHANVPVELPADLGQVQRAIRKYADSMH
jgi:threonine synthase